MERSGLGSAIACHASVNSRLGLRGKVTCCAQGGSQIFQGFAESLIGHSIILKLGAQGKSEMPDGVVLGAAEKEAMGSAREAFCNFGN